MDETFGGRLYDAIRRRSGLAYLTSCLGYEQLQSLKHSDRAETLGLLSGGERQIAEHVATCEPEALADFLLSPTENPINAQRNLLAVLLIVSPLLVLPFVRLIFTLVR
jgi:hypothetical protein